MSVHDEATNEEFNNFMFKVVQVGKIVEKLTSTDKNLQEIGDLEARQYLGEADEGKFEKLDGHNVQLKVKSNRTIINKNALTKNDDPNTQAPEAFMHEVSKDADRRYKDKLIRKEKMETFKKQATLAFRRGEYERALSLYNKAIEQIKDSCNLYCNRALTYINLRFFDKAVLDCDTALRLNENSLRALLLRAKAWYFLADKANFDEDIKRAQETHTDKIDYIEDFVEGLKKYK